MAIRGKQYHRIFLFFITIFVFLSLSIWGFDVKACDCDDDDNGETPNESMPRGIAINSDTGQAVYTSKKSDTVKVYDLKTRSVIAAIRTGREPKDVAIDKTLNVALIGNSKDDTVSFLDLVKLRIVATIHVGNDPAGIAIDQSRHLAAVTNLRDNTISVINIATQQVIATVPTGKRPIDAAIYDNGGNENIALVVNRKDRELSVIDMVFFKPMNTFNAGRKPRGIAINPDANVAVVTDVQGNSITVINLQTWQSRIIKVGKHPIDVAVNTADNRAVVICEEEKKLYLVDITNNRTIQTYDLHAHGRGVAIDSHLNLAAVVDDESDKLIIIQLPFATSPPAVRITAPLNNAALNAPSVTVSGNVTNAKTVTVNGVSASITEGVFSALIYLTEGLNTITATATDSYGRTASDSIKVTAHVKLTITGKVTNSLTGYPVPAANVSITDATNITQTAVTDSSGNYTINNVAMGSFKGTAGKQWYATNSFARSPSTDLTITENITLDPIAPIISDIKVTEITPNYGMAKRSNELPFDRLLAYNTIATSTIASDMPSDSMFYVPVKERPAVYQLAIAPPPPPGSVVQITWKTDQPSDSRVEYFGSDGNVTTVSDATLTTDHSIILGGSYTSQLSPSRTYQYRVKSTGENGATAVSPDASFRTKGQINLTVTALTNGISIVGNSLLVRGAFTDTSESDVTITVNGIAAAVANGQFALNNVPLTEGANTITVTVTDAEGNTATKTITVNATTTGNYIKATVSPDTGPPPLEITLRISGSVVIASPTIIPSGPNQVEQLESFLTGEYRYRMTVEGLYFFTVKGAGQDGKFYQDTVAVEVSPLAKLDTFLIKQWTEMKNALLAGNIEAALGYFASGSKDKFRQILNNLGSAKIISTFSKISEIHLSNVYGKVASYGAFRVEAGGTYSYPLIFIKDETDGIWKIWDF